MNRPTLTIRTWMDFVLLAVLCAATWPTTVSAEQEPESGHVESTAGDDQTAKIPPPRKEYMGRRIAPTMHFSHAAWLTRDRRQKEEDTNSMIEALGIKPGQTVCDLGCGNGYHSLKMAELVGKKGMVLAVDIQKEMLDMLAERAKRYGFENIKQIHSTVVDPRLPKGKVDLVLLVDVYHEFSHPELMLESIRESLSDDGRVVLVEFRSEDPDVPILPLHKMSRKQVLKELAANGYKLVGDFDKLPWQHMMFFSRDDSAAAPSRSGKD